MNNPEWLNNINSLLPQMKALSEKNPVIQKLLEMASNAAKQSQNTSDTSLLSFIDEKEGNEESPPKTVVSNSAESIKKTIDAVATPIGNLLDQINNTAKQLSTLAPFFQNLMKDRLTMGQSNKTPFTSGTNTAGNSPATKPFVNLILIILFVVFIMNFFFRF